MRAVTHTFRIEEFHSAYDYQWDENFVFYGEQHNFWEIVTVLSGEVEAVEDDRVYHLHRGEMLLHAPMEFHTIRSAARSSPHVLVLSFSATGEVPSSLKSGSFLLSEELQDTYRGLFSRCFRFYAGQEDTPYTGQACAMELALFLITLSREKGRARLSDSPAAREYQSAVQCMRRGVCQNLTLPEIARDCHSSVSTLKQLFQRYAGISPKAYYTKLRYDEALRRLKAGHSVAQVSEEMGFSSPNYFSAFIKRQTGLPPARFLRAITTPSEPEDLDHANRFSF